MDIETISDRTALPLHSAVMQGNVKFAQRIINAGCNVEIEDDEGRTAIIIAVSHTENISLEIVKLLLEADAEILRSAEKSNRSALEIVVNQYETKNEELLDLFLHRVKYLCNNNIDVMAEILFFVNCPLEYIVCMGNSELTKHMLLTYDYAVNAKNPFSKFTPLHAAVQKMDFENVKVLVEHGADVNAQDIYNQVPLSFYSTAASEMENHLDILRFLIENGTILTGPGLQGQPSPIFLLMIVGTKRVIRLLLRYSDISAQANRPATLLHSLSFNKNPGIAKELKNKTFNVDALDEEGYTCLMYASSSCNRNTIRFLLSNGANVNHRVKNITPLLAPLAFTYIYKISSKTRAQYEACAEIFLQKGATLDVILAYPVPPAEVHRSFYNLESQYIYYTIRRPILAHLAKLETLNQPVKDEFRKKINSFSTWKKLFNLYRRELRDMKNIKIYHSLNMFTLINDVQMQFVKRYHCHSKIISKLCSVNKDFPNSYLYRQLKNRIKKAIKILKTRVVASAFLSKILNLPKIDHIVTQKITNYLNYKEHKKLVRVYCIHAKKLNE